MSGQTNKKVPAISIPKDIAQKNTSIYDLSPINTSSNKSSRTKYLNFDHCNEANLDKKSTIKKLAEFNKSLKLKKQAKVKRLLKHYNESNEKITNLLKSMPYSKWRIYDSCAIYNLKTKRRKFRSKSEETVNSDMPEYTKTDIIVRGKSCYCNVIYYLQ